MGFLRKISDVFFRGAKELDLDLNGKWQGFFNYSPLTHHLLRNKKSYFELIMSEKDGHVDGYFLEEIIKGELDDQICFYGSVKGKRIEFHKIYKYLYLIGHDGVINKDERISSPLVKYVGYYYRHSDKFIGDWNMKYKVQGYKQSMSGLWEMKKTHPVK